MSDFAAVRRWKAAAAGQSRTNARVMLGYLSYAGLIGLLTQTDAFDAFYRWWRRYEDWQVDEFILAAAAISLGGFVFVVFRWRGEHKGKQRIQQLSDELQTALQAANSADQAKAAFLANLSHELRTPINAINGYAHLMELGMMGPINARYAGYAKDIRESGEHLLNLINDILDISRAVAGTIRLRRENLDLHGLTTRSLKLLTLRAEEAEIVLCNLVPRDFPMVNADPQRLGQILINLVGNAVKFSPAGSEVQVAATTRGDTAVIEVSDRGIGMAAEDIVLALEPFVQIEAGLGKNPDGAGLGLALVKRFAELHGGTLSFESEPGRGTTAIVTLPQAVVPASPRQEVVG